MSAMVRHKGRSQCSPTRNFYHISFAGECQMCFDTCQKPRRLPCEHEFCKLCLSEYFDRNVPDEDPNTFFPCPSCNKPIDKPSLPKPKWTKAFKLDKRTLFYTDDGPLSAKENSSFLTVPHSNSYGGVEHTVLRNVNRRATTHGKPSARESSAKRAAVHFAGVHKKYLGFNTKISTDTTECIYWGGAILDSGNVVLADFYNRCIKVFTVYGKHICHVKIQKRPFDLTEIHDNTIVVSHGAHSSSVTFISYGEEDIVYTGNVEIHGYLYHVTRKGKQGLGIFETPEGKIKIARVSAGGTVKASDPGDEVTVFLSTNSHVIFDEKDDRYYFTEMRNLLCVDSSFNILYYKSYPYMEKDHYFLGSLGLDGNGTVYVGSDLCVLRIDKEGNDLQGTIPTKFDPYHILVTSDGSKLILVGRRNRVYIYMPPQE